MQKPKISITNTDELEAWLEGKPAVWAQIIAARSALRVLPHLQMIYQPQFPETNLMKEFVANGFRANMVSWVALKYPTRDFTVAAFAAAKAAADAATYFIISIPQKVSLAATNAANSAANAAASATVDVAGFSSVNAVDNAASAVRIDTKSGNLIWRALEFDAIGLNQEFDVITFPIWHGKNSSPFKRQTQSLMGHLRNDESTNWLPWVNWYESVRDGKRVYPQLPPEQEEALLVEWALIDPKDWEQGSEHVNQLIRKIEQKHFALVTKAVKTKSTKTPPSKPVRKKNLNPPEIPPVFSSHVPPMDDSVDPTIDYLDRADIALALAGRLNEVWDTKNPDGGNTGKWQDYINAENLWRKLIRPGDNGDLKPGYVVHLDAPWGGGKTSFAGFVSRILNPWRIADKQPDWLKKLDLNDLNTWKEEFHRPWYIVKFNAWQHQHVKPPWWTFSQTIRNQCLTAMRDETNHRTGKEMPAPVEDYSYRSLAARWCRWAWCSTSEILWRLSTPKFLLSIVISTISITALYWLITNGQLAIADGKAGVGTGNGSWLSTALVLLLGGAAPLWALFTGLTATLLPGTPNAANNYSLGAGDPLERFRKHFAKMIERFHRPVLVIVDDLDRCKPEFVVELVRGMQTILVSPRIVFILLGDRDWIEKSFSEVHKVMKGIDVGKEHEFGARFVEKAIQFSFVLPDIDEQDRREYVRALLDIKEAEKTVKGPAPASKAAKAISTVATQMAEIINMRDFQAREIAASELIKSSNYKDIPEVHRQKIDFDIAKKLSRRAVSDTSVDRGTGHMIEALAPVLPPNPRQIKRIINTLSLLQQTMRLDDHTRNPGSPDWQVLVRWVVLMTEWPKTWYTLTIHPYLVDKVHNSRKYKKIDLPKDQAKALADKIRGEETAMAILNFKEEKNGWPARKITSTEILWLKQLMPATSGEPLVIEKPEKK